MPGSFSVFADPQPSVPAQSGFVSSLRSRVSSVQAPTNLEQSPSSGQVSPAVTPSQSESEEFLHGPGSSQPKVQGGNTTLSEQNGTSKMPQGHPFLAIRDNSRTSVQNNSGTVGNASHETQTGAKTRLDPPHKKVLQIGNKHTPLGAPTSSKGEGASKTVPGSPSPENVSSTSVGRAAQAKVFRLEIKHVDRSADKQKDKHSSKGKNKKELAIPKKYSQRQRRDKRNRLLGLTLLAPGLEEANSTSVDRLEREIAAALTPQPQDVPAQNLGSYPTQVPQTTALDNTAISNSSPVMPSVTHYGKGKPPATALDQDNYFEILQPASVVEETKKKSNELSEANLPKEEVNQSGHPRSQNLPVSSDANRQRNDPAYRELYLRAARAAGVKLPTRKHTLPPPLHAYKGLHYPPLELQPDPQLSQRQEQDSAQPPRPFDGRRCTISPLRPWSRSSEDWRQVVGSAPSSSLAQPSNSHQPASSSAPLAVQPPISSQNPRQTSSPQLHDSSQFSLPSQLASSSMALLHPIPVSSPVNVPPAAAQPAVPNPQGGTGRNAPPVAIQSPGSPTVQPRPLSNRESRSFQHQHPPSFSPVGQPLKTDKQLVQVNRPVQAPPLPNKNYPLGRNSQEAILNQKQTAARENLVESASWQENKQARRNNKLGFLGPVTVGKRVRRHNREVKLESDRPEGSPIGSTAGKSVDTPHKSSNSKGNLDLNYNHGLNGKTIGDDATIPMNRRRSGGELPPRKKPTSGARPGTGSGSFGATSSGQPTGFGRSTYGQPPTGTGLGAGQASNYGRSTSQNSFGYSTYNQPSGYGNQSVSQPGMGYSQPQGDFGRTSGGYGQYGQGGPGQEQPGAYPRSIEQSLQQQRATGLNSTFSGSSTGGVMPRGVPASVFTNTQGANTPPSPLSSGNDPLGGGHLSPAETYARIVEDNERNRSSWAGFVAWFKAGGKYTMLSFMLGVVALAIFVMFILIRTGNIPQSPEGEDIPIPERVSEPAPTGKKVSSSGSSAVANVGNSQSSKSPKKNTTANVTSDDSGNLRSSLLKPPATGAKAKAKGASTGKNKNAAQPQNSSKSQNSYDSEGFRQYEPTEKGGAKMDDNEFAPGIEDIGT